MEPTPDPIRKTPDAKRRTHTLKLFVVGFLLLVLASGCVTNTAGGQLLVPTVFDAWVGIASVLLMISLGLMILVYVLGNVLMNERMKAWAKLELFEIFYSLVILAFALYAVGAADSVVQGVVKDNDPYTQCICAPQFPLDERSGVQMEGTIYSGIQECHIRLALYFLNTVFTESNDMALRTYLSYIITSTLADAQMTMENVFELSGMFTFTPWRGLFAMGNTIKSEVFEKYILVMMVSMFQEQLVRFIAVAFYPVVFVMGVVLRAFTFTRKLGGLLMAIALALFFIYPMFYAFGALIINQIKVRHFDPANPVDPPIAARLYVHGTVPSLNGRDFVLQDEERNTRVLTERLERTGLCTMPMRIDQPTGTSLEATRTNPGTQPPRFTLYQDPAAAPPTIADVQQLAVLGDEWFRNISRTSWYDGRLGGGTQTPGATSGGSSGGAPQGAIMFQSGGEIDILARLAFFSMFFGILGILATIAAIKNLSVLLGGDTEIAGLTHLI